MRTSLSAISRTIDTSASISTIQQRAKSIDQELSVTMDTDQLPFTKILQVFGSAITEQNVRQILRTKLFQNSMTGTCCSSRNMGHERQVLDKSDGLSF
jgi:hypothetical protein